MQSHGIASDILFLCISVSIHPLFCCGYRIRKATSTREHGYHDHQLLPRVQNDVVESTSMVGTIEAMNLRKTTR